MVFKTTAIDHSAIPPATTQSYERLGESLPLPDEIETTHVGLQRCWHLDGAVLLLVVVQDCSHRPGQCQAGSVESVDELRLPAFVPVTNVEPLKKAE